MPISEAVLRRRQLDLDKRTEDLQKYFERLGRSHMADMPATWRKLDGDIKKKLKNIYLELGAITDPAKIKALAGKADRLEAYAANIQKDIDRVTMATQAHTTGMLKGQFERSYYMNGWAIEQAAKVTASIPVLSSAQVLGVLANPWLPDGANYALRINGSNRYLADKMKRVVKQAVTEGLGWNETARLISANTTESYFHAVRLARTELTRAAALGASYSYMQNNDIMDGKRWNATLDSRTAPKDANNDRKPYDIDYDTPENPGVPGQRIPNHPNCRCLWSPILSALGINDRERIARGDGDTPTNFGKRIYTKAPTYREYAKERGLPDLDDRLLKDNLKSYLRPGETIDDLQKTVKRFTLNGNTIVVPSPDWGSPQMAKPLVQKAAPEEPLAAGSWADPIKARIAQGVNSESDVREVGAMLRQRLTDYDDDIQKQMDYWGKKQDDLCNVLNEFDPEDYEGDLYKQITEEMQAAGNKYYDLVDLKIYDQAEKLKLNLAEIRKVGPIDANDVQPWIAGSRVDVKAQVDKVRSFLPTEWLEASNRRPMKATKTKRGFYREAYFKDEAEATAKGYTQAYLKSQKRMYLLEDTINLSGDGDGMLRVAFHEMGHRMEDAIPNIKKLENEFYARRTLGESLQHMGYGYGAKERTRFDKFLNKYMGKDYGNTADSYYELLSMGLESAYHGSYDLTTDTDYADFIYGILASQ